MYGLKFFFAFENISSDNLKQKNSNHLKATYRTCGKIRNVFIACNTAFTQAYKFVIYIYEMNQFFISIKLNTRTIYMY